MTQEKSLVDALQGVLNGTEQPEVFLEVVTDEAVARMITVDDATRVAGTLRQGQGQRKIVAAHILSILVEKLAAIRQTYNCREAAILNDEIEAIFTAQDLQIPIAHCRLFKAHYSATQGRFIDVFDALDMVPDAFRISGDTYALACALLLRSQSRLRLARDRHMALAELSEAENIFKSHNDEVRLGQCQELREHYML